VDPRDRERLSDYLLKPLDFDELERVLVRILAVAPGV
jgi:YesN/AraC family two-component response regulator